MSDLIRREEAMRVIKDDWDASFSREDVERAEICKFHFIEISNIPTAEPNWIPLHFDEYKMASDYPNEMDGKWVIVTDGKNISVERIKKDAYDHFYPSGRWFEMENVIAWMPLPKHYEMERSE